jgi:MFS transporter, FSR family, fosmidomycin resistance protein
MSAPLAMVNTRSPETEKTAFKILGAISFSHLLNDLIQSLLPAIYPLLKNVFSLNFTQIGLITLTFQLTASVLQPVVGLYTDHHPKPYSLSIGMGCTLIGLIFLAFAPTYGILLIAAAMVGMGSSIFHPESSRVARMASGGRFGLAQSIFQVGGNAGTATGPLLAALIIIPHGRTSIAWFSLVALIAMLVLWQVGNWYKRQQSGGKRPGKSSVRSQQAPPARLVAKSMIILLILIFSKFFYMASLNSYYMFFLIHKFQLSVQSAQMYLFVFLSAVAMGTILGGHLGDRIGRKRVIWISILGVTPFTLMLPYANLAWTGPLAFIIGLILSSAFPAIVVFAQELLPGKVGMVAGLFFGLAFGMAGIGAAVLGKLADVQGIESVYRMCAFLPLLGLVTVFLPDIGRPASKKHPPVKAPAAKNQSSA